MEQLLLKMARQLETLDEASLLALWDKYATVVSRFEPSKRWEEATLVLALIQAKHWKNHLFNYHWATQARPGKPGDIPMPRLAFSLEKNEEASANRPRARVLPFRPKSTEKPEPENTPSENPDSDNPTRKE